MKNKCITDQRCFKVVAQNADAHIDVFPKTHGGKPTCDIKNLSGEAHVEASGKEFVHLFVATPDSTCGEKTGHRVIDGFLRGGE